MGSSDVDKNAHEVVTMILQEDDDVTIGRMPVGGSGDESDFDFAPPYEAWMTPEQAEVFFDGDDGGEEFAAPEEHFPLFKRALSAFQAKEPKPRVVRIDTEQSYDHFVADKAVDEIARRLSELRSAFEAHVSDHHGGQAQPIRPWSEVLGSAEAISDLRGAASADEVHDQLQKVSLDLPEYADGKVKCWKDGDYVVVSIRFLTVDGPRVATVAARPHMDSDQLCDAVSGCGGDEVEVLGLIEEAADIVCGQRLLRDVAGCALQAQKRVDVMGMDHEPLLLASDSVSPGTAPLAALMHLYQAAEAGDAQARREVALIERAAKTPLGQKVAAPLLSEAKDRLALGRQKTLVEKVKGWLR